MSWLRLNTVKQFLQISHTAEDDALRMLVEGVEAALSLATNIHLSTTAHTDGEEFTEDLDGGGLGLRPKYLPIRSVSAVLDRENDDEDITDSETIDHTPSRIVREDDESEWDDGVQRYRVTYRGGYGVSDTDREVASLKLVALQVCHQIYHGRDTAFDDVLKANTGLAAQVSRLSLKQRFA